MYKVPNIPTEDVPVGKDESDNKVLRQVGKKPNFSFKPKEHWELGKSLDVIDNERAARVSGARFTYLKRELALLEFALIQHTLSVLTSESTLKKIIKKAKLNVKPTPFIPVVPPVLIRPDVFQKMARLEPKEERYHIPSDDLYLIGSAEHTLGPLHMDETLLSDELPLRYLGFSTAFRREAGSYGKDTKGILRVHQFDKLEMESFSLPDRSIEEQNFFVAIQEHLVDSLGLAYQVVMICTGDMGGPDARQVDIEIWMPGQNKYRETHTADLMTDYQARRLNIKIKGKDFKSELVHMNDATAFAIGRTIIAIMENYQTEKGTVKIPKALQKYMLGIKEIKPH
ncbi:MAG: serine--tRNA ligase, partial [Candidatus Paceibacterota bacterium]